MTHIFGADVDLTKRAAAVLIAAGCLAVAWLRIRFGSAATGPRGRYREFAWCAALVLTAVVVAASVGPSSWILMAPALAAVVLLLRPRLAASVVPALLVILALAGIGLARELGLGVNDASWYGLAGTGTGRTTLVLVQAYGFLALGGWLGWRQLRARPPVARLVLGRTAALRPPEQLRVLLLLPLVVAWAATVGSGAWFLVLIVAAVPAAVLIRRAPDLAARVTVLAFIGFGLAGLLLIHSWSHEGTIAASPSGNTVLVPGPATRYGLVDLQGGAPDVVGLAPAEALALLGFGGWLVPGSFPFVRRILCLGTEAQLTRQVEQLTESRAVAVDTAAADLRRLERDLHDGAQARLVALGMNLRAAEKLIATSPEAAAALVAEARESSARALTELRELVRGVHPPVLADRGLTDAVRALALDSPLNVVTELDLAGRVAAPIETACYFSIAEVLTNAAKHSGARDARILIRHAGGLLRIEVTDFGLGGADPARGSGLAGVEKRLATFDGILAVSSPPGGPTIVVMEVPCALSLPRISSC
jgi:signal transduction histidine kinase